MTHNLKILLIILVATYVFVALYLYMKQEEYIFFPEKEYREPPSYLEVRDVFINTPDGESLHGWWMDGEEGAKTVVFFHGNAGNISDRVTQMEVFQKLKLNVLIIDYRGYGKSSGVLESEEELYIDGKSAYDYLIDEKKILEEEIIVWGRSLGGAVAIEIAQNKNVAAVVSESTFYSMNDMAMKQYWFMPRKLLLKYKFANFEKVKNITAPILIVHSKDDEIVPFDQGEGVFKEALEPKEFLQIRGGHNSGIYEFYDIYFEGVKKFIDKL